MDKENDQKKIAVGKNSKKSQIIINPPEKVDPQRGYQEAFKRALEKHTVVLEKKTEVVLHAKAQKAELPTDVIEQVYKRGYKSLPLNTDLTREQYAMNRVNSFIAGGAAMKEDCDLLPIVEYVRTTMGMKGTGGAMRPHIKRERSPYNNRIIYHVVDSKGRVKHSTDDEGEAKKHLATKYNTYMEMTVSPMKRFEGTKSLVKTYKGDTPGEKKAVTEARSAKSGIVETDVFGSKAYHAKCMEPGCEWQSKRYDKIKQAHTAAQQHAEKHVNPKQGVAEEKMKGEDPCWKGYHMVGKKLKAGREVPNCVPVKEAASAAVRMQKALDKIKTDRERRERLAAPYVPVKSVFDKQPEKDDKK